MNLTSQLQSTETPVSVATHVYASALMHIWVRRNWYWAFALPIAAAIAAAATLSLNWLLIAVVMACLVCPHIIVCVYYYHALSPDSRMSILPHTIKVTDQAVTLTYVATDPDSNSPLPPPDIIPAARITGIRHTGQLTIITLDKGSYNVIVQPINMPVPEKEEKSAEKLA